MIALVYATCTCAHGSLLADLWLTVTSIASAWTVAVGSFRRKWKLQCTCHDLQNFSKSALSLPSNPRSGSPHRPSPLQRRKIWLNILIYPPRHPAPTTAFVPPLQLRSRPRTPLPSARGARCQRDSKGFQWRSVYKFCRTSAKPHFHLLYSPLGLTGRVALLVIIPFFWITV